MDQILPIVVGIFSRLDWISIVMSGVCGILVANFASLFARSFALSGIRFAVVWFAIAAISFWPVRIAAKTYVNPYLYEWRYEEDILRTLSQTPLYAALLEHHPESRSALVRATIKSVFDEKASLVGQIELSAIVMHYLAIYFPHTSDDAAKQFATAIMGLFHHMLVQDPGLCVEVLYGAESQRDATKRFSRLSPVVLDRLGQVGGKVIIDAIERPMPVPTPDRIEDLRQRVIERMTSDGNPLMTGPEQLMNDPRRACFAVMATFETAWKTVPADEFGAFLRGTIPGFLADDDI